MSEPLAIGGDRWQALLAGRDRWRWLAIGLFLALGIGLRSPWPADEPRFALIALDMVQAGHWLLPHRGGEIYADKPPLFMWLQAAGFLLTGNMRIAFLLPSLAAAMTTLWLVHDLTRRLFDREAAWFAVLLLLVTVQFSAQARSGQIDATLCAFTTLGLYGLVRHLHLGPQPGWYAVAWLAMGLGVITKGVGFLPVFALPGLVLVRQLRRARSLGNVRLSGALTWIAPLLILVPAVLWLTPLWLRAAVDGQGEVARYLGEILFRQTVTRYADGFGHVHPPWYYVTSVIPALWMPLSFLLLWLVPGWLRGLRQLSVAHWMVFGYLLLGLLFFSASPGKRGVYMLPLLPAAATLAGPAVGVLRGRLLPAAGLRIAALLVGIVLLALAAATSFDLGPVSERIQRADLAPMPAMAFLLATGSVWTVAALLLRSGAAFAVALLSTWLLFTTWGYPLLDPVRSGSQLMADVASRAGAESDIAIVGFKEQQLLQADRDIVHWRYHDNLAAQAAAAANWLNEASGRRVLIAESAAGACFTDGAGVSLGYRHRREWKLMSAADIDAGPDCVISEKVTRFRATSPRYPAGTR